MQELVIITWHRKKHNYAEVSKGSYKPWCQRNTQGLHLLPVKKISYLEKKNRRGKKTKQNKEQKNPVNLYFFLRLIWIADKSNKFRQQP